MNETSTLQNIIKIKENIKNKLLDLKRRKQETEELLSETFKPIATPLTNLSSSLEKLRFRTTSDKTKLENEKEKKVSLEDVDDYNDEVFETPVKKMKTSKSEKRLQPDFLKDEETIESPAPDISPKQLIKEQFQTKEELEKSSQDLLGHIAGKYMSLYAIDSPDIDNIYGIRLDPITNKFMIGDSEVEIDNNDLNIGGRWFIPS